VGFVFGDKARADDDIVVGYSFHEDIEIFRTMLPIGIELDCAVVTLVAGVFNSCLECACEAEVDRQIQEAKLVSTAYVSSRVCGAIVHDDVIIRRVVANEFPHDSFKIIGFVISRYHQNRSHDVILPRSSAERERGENSRRCGACLP